MVVDSDIRSGETIEQFLTLLPLLSLTIPIFDLSSGSRGSFGDQCRKSCVRDQNGDEYALMRLPGDDEEVPRRKETRTVELWLVHVCCRLDVVTWTKPGFLQIEHPIPKHTQKKSNSKAMVGDPRITTFDL